MKFAVSSVSGRKREGAVIFDCSIISSETCIRLRLYSRPTPCPSPAPDFQSAGWENSSAGRSISSVWKLRTVLEFVPISFFHPDHVHPEPCCQRSQSSHLCRHPFPAGPPSPYLPPHHPDSLHPFPFPVDIVSTLLLIHLISTPRPSQTYVHFVCQAVKNLSQPFCLSQGKSPDVSEQEVRDQVSVMDASSVTTKFTIPP